MRANSFRVFLAYFTTLEVVNLRWMGYLWYNFLDFSMEIGIYYLNIESLITTGEPKELWGWRSKSF